MKPTSKNVQTTYLLLTLFSTLAASFIWGINTLFLLDAGLTNAQAFAANAFFTLGQVIFEVPTGVVADTRGRRTSYALGVLTLLIATLVYYYLWRIHGPFWAWSLVSVFLGLGFTFFSGATEAWLVDALHFTGYKGNLESVFAKGQTIGGVAMLVGAVSGGFIAQYTDLGFPYILRSIVLGATLVVCLAMMRDLGFKPRKGETAISQVKVVLRASIEEGFKNPPVRWTMIAAPFTAGVGFYVFYAMQPYLMNLYGEPTAYGIAGLAAAIIAGAQVVGGLLVSRVLKHFRSRMNILIGASVLSAAIIVLLGFTHHFWIAIVLLVVWGLVGALVVPVRLAYLNGLIASQQRATVLSFDSLMGSSGGVVVQPGLGKVADVQGYGASYLVGGAIQLLAPPFLLLAKKQKASSDIIQK